MKKMFRLLVLGFFLSLGCNANATVYEFSYTYTDTGTRISGLVNGTAVGDKITISGVDSVTVLGFTFQPNTTKFNQGSFTSASSANQNFSVAAYDPVAHNYFSFSLYSSLLYADYARLEYTINNISGTVQEDPLNGNWKLSAVSAVPEPREYLMLLAGLGLIGFLARKKIPVLKRAQ